MQLNIVYLVFIVTFQNVIEAQNYLPQEQQPPFAQFAPQSILTNYPTSSTTEKPIMTTATTTTTTTTTTTPIPTTTTTTPYTTTSTQPTTTTQPATTTSTTTTTTVPSTTSATYTVPSAIYPTNSPSVQNTYFIPEPAPSSGGFGLPPAFDISQTTINPFFQPMHQSPLNFFQSAQRKTLDFLTGGGGGGSDANGFNLGDLGGALTSILTPMAGAAAAALTAGGGASLISLPNASIQPTLQKTFVVNMGGNNPPLIVQGNAYQPGASAGGLGGGGGNPQARGGSGLDNFNIKGSLSQLAQTLGYPRYPNYPPPVYRQ